MATTQGIQLLRNFFGHKSTNCSNSEIKRSFESALLIWLLMCKVRWPTETTTKTYFKIRK